ncbi:amino acid adenylation domain-containing protein [Streptomyces vinaceus]|uniref:non-ribosomal peptide synthetase n=1 Tax=Streptomyces vinaceus TaxID=1960 RepID=UPI0035E09AB2
MTGESLTLVSMFEQSVARSPGATAVSDGRHRLSYAELSRRADDAARVLTEHGVGPGDRVAVHLPRDVELIVVLLGVLKAGAAYAAIDTSYPDARRDLMVRSAQARVCVSATGRPTPSENCGVPVVGWPADPTGTTGERTVAVRPEDAASMVFTSGSTGTPKPVVLEHRNLVAFARNRSLPTPRSEDRVGQISSVSFDLFHFELWCSLAAGAEIVMLPPVPELLEGGFQEELRRRRVTVLIPPTMVVNQVVKAEPTAFSSLRLLLTGGDVLLPATCEELFAAGFKGRLINVYGPSEGTTACTWHDVTTADLDGDPVPIGQPLDGCAIHLLDEELRPVAFGEPGQIHLGGPGVARGYLGREEATRERFLEHADLGRLYATGDLARHRADGALMFLGRADDQVKIKGYRVEPREVEHFLSNHPHLREVAVLAIGRGEDRRLAAAVVGHADVCLRSVRSHAEQQLPAHLVPAVLVLLPDMPMTAHGKRDRTELRRLLEEDAERHAGHVAPETDAEIGVSELWQELLGVERIGAQENFFHLGGHSLLAFRLAQQITERFHVQIEYADLQRHPTVRALAALIGTRSPEAAR